MLTAINIFIHVTVNHGFTAILSIIDGELKLELEDKTLSAIHEVNYIQNNIIKYSVEYGTNYSV